jgi:uncharacterized protein YjbK
LIPDTKSFRLKKRMYADRISETVHMCVYIYILSRPQSYRKRVMKYKVKEIISVCCPEAMTTEPCDAIEVDISNTTASHDAFEPEISKMTVPRIFDATIIDAIIQVRALEFQTKRSMGSAKIGIDAVMYHVFGQTIRDAYKYKVQVVAMDKQKYVTIAKQSEQISRDAKSGGITNEVQ